jgi:hypothetical protein
MNKKKIVILIAVVIVVGTLIGLLGGPGRDLSAYERLQNPQMGVLKDQNMLVVESTRDPNKEGGKAMAFLFKTYFSLPGVPKGPQQPAPRARWPKSLDSPKAEWIGRYALPLPDGLTAIPSATSDSGFKAQLAKWEYGPVAEILHVGPYSTEKPTIERLKKFILDKGYGIVGEHEEEYLRGPGMFLKGDPEKYYTIIRYRIRPVDRPKV